MEPVGGHRILVTGLGMTTALGYDVITSCAAARAGLTRPRELDGPVITDEDTEELDRTLGYSVAGVTDGFWKLGRLVRMGVAALRDLKKRASIHEWGDVGFYLNLPSGFYHREREKRERESGESASGSAGDEPYEADLRNDFYRERLLSPLLKFADLPASPSNRHLHFGDHAGFVQVLSAAMDAIFRGQYQRCIVGGIDSYTEFDVVEALNGFGLLKSTSKAAGLIPGEGAAFLLLEGEAHVRGRNGQGLACLEAPRFGAEPFHRLSGDPAVGGALSGAISGTVSSLDDGGQNTGLLVGDLNGDPYRANDWGSTLVRLKATIPWIDLPSWYPAVSFGEIGAATGAASACTAIRGFARNYAGADNVLVWLSSDDGGRGAFYLRSRVSKAMS